MAHPRSIDPHCPSPNSKRRSPNLPGTSNLITLCRFHHRLVHEGRIAIQILDDGALRYLRPDGRPYEESPAQDRPDISASALAAAHAAQKLAIDASTAATRWRGERMDYGLAVQVLLQEERGGNVPAEIFDSEP
jgi:hypothetical protein